MANDKKEKKQKTVKFRKKVFYKLMIKELGDIWGSMAKLYKIVYCIKGDIKADLTLKELDNGIWNVIISVDGKSQVDLKGHLNMVLYMIEHFRRIYNWEKEEEANKDGA